MILNSLKRIIQSPLYQAFNPENLAEGAEEVYKSALKPGVTNFAKAVGGGVRSMGQASFRGFAALGGATTGQTLTPSTQFQRDLYGTDQPITLKSFGEEIPGLKDKKIAPGVGFVLAASDLLPGGKAKRDAVIKVLQATNKVDDASKALNKLLGMSSKVAQKYAPEAAKLTDVRQLNNLVDNAIQESQDIVEIGKRAVEKVKGFAQTLRGTKGMTAEDIMAKHPNIKLTKDVPAKNIYGNPVQIPDGEKLTPYELKGNKVLLQDGQAYIVSKNQFQNIKGNSIEATGKPFAPELEGLEVSVRGGATKKRPDLEWKQDVDSKNRWIADTEMERWHIAKGSKGFVAGKSGGENSPWFSSFEEAKNYVAEKSKDVTIAGSPKYSQYTLPEGKNYREVLIKAPLSEKATQIKNTKVGYGQENIQDAFFAKEVFKSSHWDEPNVISHLRLNDRTYKGKKVTFMEELQSDWAKEGRSKGFQKELTPEEMSGEDIRYLADTSRADKIPNNPNLKNWQELSIKRALKDAVDNNSDYFAWINGEQTSARYNLATQVENIKWERRTRDGVKEILIEPKGGNDFFIKLDKDGFVSGDRMPMDWKGKKLDEVFGKGLADKIMEKESGTLSGEGLKFGGEWADNLYDKQVKNIVEDLTGQKVEMLDMGLPIDTKAKQFWTKSVSSPLESRFKVNPQNIKVGQSIFDESSNNYIITDILGDGKFKAVPKKVIENSYPEETTNSAVKSFFLEEESYRNSFPDIETFDISTKTTTQQGIKLTPEVKAKIQGKAPVIKTSGEMYGAVAGIEQDEEGKIGFDPKKALLGVLAMAGIKKLSGSPLYKGADDLARTGDTPVSKAGQATRQLDKFSSPQLSPKTNKIASALKEAKTKTLEYIQNEQERVRQLVSRKDVKITDASDPYLKATLYSGKVADKIRNTQNLVKTTLKDMAKTKITRKEVSDYLYFRHAPERNLALGGKASGITTKEAAEGLKNLKPEVKQFAEKFQKLNNEVLDILKEGGVIDDTLYKTLKAKYPNHVPLQRILEDTEDFGSVLSGKGFDVRSTGIKKAVGSEKQVADIVENIVTNYEQAVLRAEKNIVDQATLNFARENKGILDDLFEISHPKAVGKTFDGKPILEKTTDPSILQMFENGKKTWIKIKDPNLAVALRGVGREKLGGLLGVVGKFTRLYSGLATRFNPEFALPNKIRDLQEVMAYMTSQKGVGVRGALKTATKDFGSIRDIVAGLKNPNSSHSKLYNEMKSLGGTTGGFGLSTREQVALNINKLEKLANSKTRKAGDKLLEYVDNWNTIFEDSTRLSVYKSALGQGLSKERAAFLAKEASINFNRMGKGGPVINALYMFSNASIQGTTKMLRALKDPKTLAIVGTAVMGSVSAVNQWNDNIDPEWRDKVPKWDRLNGLPVILPSASGDKFHYFTIPVSWGLKPMKVTADYLYDTMATGELDTKQALEDLGVAVMESYNPVGGTDFTSALVPTIADVPVDISRNRAWSGAPIRPNYNPNAPKDIQYFDSLSRTKTGQTTISISEFLKDKLDVAISPADIKYAYDQYIGGAGRTATKTINTLAQFTDDKPLPLDEYPMISRFYRQRTGEEIGAGGEKTEDLRGLLQTQERERFQNKKEAERLYDELKKMPPDQANATAKELRKTDPLLYNKLKDVVEENKLGLTSQDKMIKSLGVENGERAKYIYQQAQKINEEQGAEAANAYIKELKDKKLISDNIMKQMRKLK